MPFSVRTLTKPDESWISLTLAALAGADVVSFHPVGGGGNNRVYRVELSDGSLCAAKFYPAQDEDPRDRLGAEFGGLSFLAEQDIGRALPRPLAADREAGVALYEWIEGEAVSASDPTARKPGDVNQALAFLRELHRLRLAPGAEKLPFASDPCFSGSGLATGIAALRRRLGEVADDHRPLREFLISQFDPAMKDAGEKAVQDYASAGMDFNADLPERNRTLSASDFGFHNVRRRADGSLVFLDFEYFGWDDPVKMTADIMLHPGTVLSADDESGFCQGLADINQEDETYGARFSTLFPLFGLRWCLIMLNEFLPERWFRRAYADEKRDRETAQARQLDKSGAMLRRVKNAKD